MILSRKDIATAVLATFVCLFACCFRLCRISSFSLLEICLQNVESKQTKNGKTKFLCLSFDTIAGSVYVMSLGNRVPSYQITVANESLLIKVEEKIRDSIGMKAMRLKTNKRDI